MRDFFREIERWVQVDRFDVEHMVAEGDKVVVLDGSARFAKPAAL